MIRKTLEWFGGSIVVYVLVAACAGAGALDDSDEQQVTTLPGAPIDTDGDGEPDGLDTDGDGIIDMPMPMSVANGDGDGSILDPILDPVPEASAAEDGTRIVNRYRTTLGGLKTPDSSGQFWDTEREEICRFLPTANGDRCLPYSPYVDLTIHFYYSDSSCTISLAHQVYGCASPRYASRAVSTGTGDSCTPNSTYEYYEVGAIHTGTAYRDSGGTCTETSLNAAITYYAVGARIPDTDFAEGSFQNGK